MSERTPSVTTPSEPLCAAVTLNPQSLTPSAQPDGHVSQALRGITSLPVRQSAAGGSTWAKIVRERTRLISASRYAVGAQQPAMESQGCSKSTSGAVTRPQEQDEAANRLETVPGSDSVVLSQVVGGASNTPLPDATREPQLYAIRPVCDTLALAMECGISDQLREALGRCNRQKNMESHLEGGWVVKEAKLKGFNHYTHTVTGTGAWSGYQIAIGPHHRPGWRKIRLMIGSAPLWRHACHDGNAYTAARETIDYLRGQLWMEPPPENEIIPRRVDVCIDHWGKRWSVEDLSRFACRQKGRGMAVGGEVQEKPHGDQWVYRAPGGTTFYLGRRGAAARFLRIYDKVAEASKTGKLPWLEPIWKAEGWDGVSTVWRAEIEHGGEWLKGHGFKTMEDLKGCESSLWLSYFSSVRHVVRRGGRIDRRETSRVWKLFGQAALRAPVGKWTWQPRAVKSSTDAAALLKQGAGCILSAEELLKDCYIRDGEGGIVDASDTQPTKRRHATLSMIDDLMSALAKQRQAITCNGI